METKTDRIIELIENQAHEQFNEFARKQLLIVVEKIKEMEEEDTSFESAVEPAMRFLFKNYNPHSKIYIDYSHAELLFGEKIHSLDSEVPD